MIEITGPATAIATTVSALVGMYTLWLHHTSVKEKFHVEGKVYYHAEGAPEACVEVTVYADAATFIRSISCKNRKVSLRRGENKQKSIYYGLRVAPHTHNRTYIELWVAPVPKDREPIELVFDIGARFYKPSYALYPNDFSDSGLPDLGQWPSRKST